MWVCACVCTCQIPTVCVVQADAEDGLERMPYIAQVGSGRVQSSELLSLETCHPFVRCETDISPDVYIL